MFPHLQILCRDEVEAVQDLTLIILKSRGKTCLLVSRSSAAVKPCSSLVNQDSQPSKVQQAPRWANIMIQSADISTAHRLPAWRRLYSRSELAIKHSRSRLSHWESKSEVPRSITRETSGKSSRTETGRARAPRLSEVGALGT